MNFNFGNDNHAGSTAPILNLQKNQILDLTKHAPALKKAILAGGWNIALSGASADLDISAYMLDSTGHIHTASDVIYFNNKTAQGIELEGDNIVGEDDNSNDDAERIDIDLERIPANYQKIVFAIVIFDAAVKKQSFGMVRNAYIRLLDANDNEREICRYNFTEDYRNNTAVIACALNRTANGWELEEIGEGLVGDLNTIAAKFM